MKRTLLLELVLGTNAIESTEYGRIISGVASPRWDIPKGPQLQLYRYKGTEGICWDMQYHDIYLHARDFENGSRLFQIYKVVSTAYSPCSINKKLLLLTT